MNKSAKVILRTAGLAVLVFGFNACSKGGDEEPAGIQLAADYNLVGIEALSTLSFPLPTSQAYAYDESLISLTETGNFTITIGKDSTSGTYALSEKGITTMLIPQTNSASLTLMGGLDRDGEAFWFTDRTLGSTNRISFWAAVKTKADAKLRGKWNVALITMVHAPATAALDPDNLALAAAGTLDIDASGQVTGKLGESSGADLDVTGTVADFDLGKLDLTLAWTKASVTYTSAFNGAVGEDVMVAAFRDSQAGGRVSLLLGVKAPTTALTAADLDGNYHVSGFTCFADPADPGSDVAAGSLEFNGTDAFSSTMYGVYSPNGFTFKGSFQLGSDGLVDLTETYPAAIPIWGAASEGARVVLMLDRTKESSDPDLSIFIAVKEWVDTSQ